MPFLKKIQRDLAVCAALLCPHCQKASKFKLQQVRTAIVLLRIPILDLHRSYQLACSSCGFQKDLEPRELFAAFRAKRLFFKLEKNEIDPAYYLMALEALKFPSLRELRKGAQTWNCPGCTEKVRRTSTIVGNVATPVPTLIRPVQQGTETRRAFLMLSSGPRIPGTGKRDGPVSNL